MYHKSEILLLRCLCSCIKLFLSLSLSVTSTQSTLEDLVTRRLTKHTALLGSGLNSHVLHSIRNTHKNDGTIYMYRYIKLCKAQQIYNYGEKVSEKTLFRVGIEQEKVQKQGGDEKASRTIYTPLRNDAGPLSGLQRNALASLVHFVTYTTKRTKDASALRWRPERGPASFRSGVYRVLEAFSSPPCFCTFFSSIPTRNKVFSETFSPPSFCSFGGFLNQLSKYNSFHLRIPHHTADERVDRLQRDSLCYSPPNTTSHCRQTRSSLATNAFCAGPETNTFGAGDERVSHWRRARFALETNTLKTCVRIPAIHTHS